MTGSHLLLRAVAFTAWAALGGWRYCLSSHERIPAQQHYPIAAGAALPHSGGHRRVDHNAIWLYRPAVGVARILCHKILCTVIHGTRPSLFQPTTTNLCTNLEQVTFFPIKLHT